MSNADVLERPVEQETTGEEKFSHYAEKAQVTEGYIMGTAVMALCGKIFVPSRDPEKYRVCPVCKEIIDGLFLDRE